MLDATVHCVPKKEATKLLAITFLRTYTTALLYARTYLRCGGKYYAILLEISSSFQQ